MYCSDMISIGDGFVTQIHCREMFAIYMECLISKFCWKLCPLLTSGSLSLLLPRRCTCFRLAYRSLLGSNSLISWSKKPGRVLIHRSLTHHVDFQNAMFWELDLDNVVSHMHPKSSSQELLCPKRWHEISTRTRDGILYISFIMLPEWFETTFIAEVYVSMAA